MYPATISIRTLPPRAFIRMRGAVDISVVTDLRAAVRGAVDGGCRHVDLDLTDVSFMDCAGVNALLWCRAHAAGSGGRVTIAHVSRSVDRILSLTGQDHELLDSTIA